MTRCFCACRRKAWIGSPSGTPTSRCGWPNGSSGAGWSQAMPCRSGRRSRSGRSPSCPPAPSRCRTGSCRNWSRRWARSGSVHHVSSRSIDAELGEGTAEIPMQDARNGRIVEWLQRTERAHGFVLYEADPTPTVWTTRCLRQADRVVRVARAGAPAGLNAIEQQLLAPGSPSTPARQELVLLHARRRRADGNGSRWLAARPVDAHHHVAGRRDRALPPAGPAGVGTGRGHRLRRRRGAGLRSPRGGAGPRRRRDSHRRGRRHQHRFGRGLHVRHGLGPRPAHAEAPVLLLQTVDPPADDPVGLALLRPAPAAADHRRDPAAVGRRPVDSVLLGLHEPLAGDPGRAPAGPDHDRAPGQRLAPRHPAPDDPGQRPPRRRGTAEQPPRST